MAKKTLLTEAEASRLLREIIIADELYAAGLLSEAGFWDNIKYGLSKLGSLEKGGKIFGGGKKQKAAEEQLAALLDKAENATIKGFTQRMQKRYPKWPNQKSHEEFSLAILDPYTLYDSWVAAATKKQPGDEGYLPCDAANGLIDALRKVVQKWLDYDLADVYKHFTEEQQRYLDTLTEEELNEVGLMSRLKGAWKGFKGAGADQGESPPEGGDDAQKDADAPLTGKDSSTIAGLKSNLAPAALGLTGAALLLAAYVMSSEKFIQWLGKILTKTKPNELSTVVTQGVAQEIGPLEGEGFTQMFGRLGGDATRFSADTPVSELFKEFGKYNINPKNPTALFELGVNPEAYAQALQSGASTIGEMFPASNQGLWLKLGKKASVTIGKAIAKKAAGMATMTMGGGAAAAGIGAAAAGTLAPLGVALIVSAGAVKALRMKSLKSSRAKSLKDLLDALQPVDCEPVILCPDGSPPPCEEEPPGGECTEEQTAAGMVWRDDLDPPQCACPPGSKLDKETQKCVEDKKSQRLKPILIKLDNDALEKDAWKLYSTTIRSDKAGERWNDLFSGVQKQGVMGREELEELLTVTDGELLDEAEGDDEGGDTQYSDAFEAQAGKGRIRRQRMSPRSIRRNLNKLRKRYGDNLKVYYAFDGSLYSDLEKVGIDKAGAQKIAGRVIKAVDRTDELPPLDQKEVLRAIGRRKPKTVYKILQRYLVSPESKKKVRESQRATPRSESLHEGQRLPTLEELNENKTVQRWKLLAGISTTK